MTGQAVRFFTVTLSFVKYNHVFIERKVKGDLNLIKFNKL